MEKIIVMLENIIKYSYDYDSMQTLLEASIKALKILDKKMAIEFANEEKLTNIKD